MFQAQGKPGAKAHPSMAITLLEEAPKPSVVWSSISLTLGWAVLVGGILTALATAYIVYRTYTPVLFWDQWNFVTFLSRSGGRLSLMELWAQHNEHRIPWGKLAAFADLRLFGGRNISLLFEIYIIRGLQSLFVIWMLRRHSDFDYARLLTAAGVIIFCMFCPTQIGNFYWGFQVSYVLLPLAACLAIGSSVIHADSARLRAWWSGALMVSLAAGVVAETSLASGVLIWPFLALVSFVYRMPWRTKVLIACIGVLAISMYMWGYRQPDQTANPLESMRKPLSLARYLGIYFGWSWDTTLLARPFWPTFGQFCSLLAVGAVIVGLIRILFSGAEPTKLRAFLLVYMAFLLTMSVMTALGRINLGLEQATSSRYQSIALDFWGCFAVFLLLRRSPAGESSARLVEIQAILLMLLLASLPRFFSSMAEAEGRQLALRAGWEELSKNPSTASGKLYWVPVPEAYSYLISHHMGPDPETPPGLMSDISPTGSKSLQVSGFQILPSRDCYGYFAVSRVPGRPGVVTVQGWAWNMVSATRPKRVLLALADGLVIGTVAVGIPRPDVQAQVAQITDPNTGWMMETVVRPGATLRAFAVGDDSKSVCPLISEFKFR